MITPLDDRINRPRILESQFPVSLLRSMDAMRFSCLLLLLSLTDLFCVSYSLTTTSSPSTASSFLFGFSSLPRQRSLVLRAARYQRSFESYSDHDEISLQRSTDRPTKTFAELIGPSVSPPKPKIVVLGATGKIGRQVVKQLLEMKSADDMTVVALVRNYDKAIHVLYDELVLARGKSGPKLQIIEGNLVPPEELPGFEANQEEEEIWKQTASSAAAFYGTKRKDYDNRSLLPDVNEALEIAIQDCTTIISCVGSVRPTNLWTDILQRPLWRLLKADVSGWCQDGSHPFYVHYASTRKALGYAEREQLRREAAATALADAEELDQEEINVPRIRFVRISDLVVAQKPWHFVPVITNAVHSMVFRYQEMTEQLLESSSMLETVVLRPGDLVDDDRDDSTTSLQVCPTGVVPSPARVGRKDVAALAVAAALFSSHNDTNKSEPFHYTLGVRWVGDKMDPFPPQGRQADGLTDADTCMQRALGSLRSAAQRSEERRQALEKKDYTGYSSRDVVLRLANQLHRRRQKPKPYGICVAIPLYVFLGMLSTSLICPVLQHLPGGKTWILPALSKMNERLGMLASYIIGQLILVLSRMAGRKQYISF